MPDSRPPARSLLFAICIFASPVPEAVGLHPACPAHCCTSLLQALDGIDLPPGSRILVHGGSGGVGGMAVQLAKLRGWHVTATCSPKNAAYVRCEARMTWPAVRCVRGHCSGGPAQDHQARACSAAASETGCGLLAAKPLWAVPKFTSLPGRA